MPSENTFDVKYSVRIVDSKSENDLELNDEYDFHGREGDYYHIFRYYQVPRGPNTVWMEADHPSIEDLPQRVAGRVQAYIENSEVSWADTFDSSFEDIEREKAEITIEGDEIFYFDIVNCSILTARRENERILWSDIPYDIRQVAKKYIPDSVEKL